MDNLSMVIGGNIKQLRCKLGIPQYKLERILGTNGGAVSRWEMGLTTPNAYYLYKLSMVFKCSIDRLFVGAGE